MTVVSVGGCKRPARSECGGMKMAKAQSNDKRPGKELENVVERWTKVNVPVYDWTSKRQTKEQNNKQAINSSSLLLGGPHSQPLARECVISCGNGGKVEELYPLPFWGFVLSFPFLFVALSPPPAPPS